ncbi:MAG: hypothetical protein HY819_17840 [Acidobacteria bacterium]|nr:hypothetical protein [Acidobacteriota bacterium]
MKRSIIFLMLVVLLTLSLVPQKATYANLVQKPNQKPTVPTGWKEYVSTGGNFAVLLPAGQVAEEKSPQIRVKLDVGPRTYGVARLDGFKFGESAQATVEGAANDFLTTAEGRAIDKLNTPLGGYPGATIKFETAEPPGVTEARFYLVGKYMYAIIAFTRNGNSQDDATRFLNSFRLLNDKPSPK